MGIDVYEGLFLLQSRANGVDYSDCVMLGRQRLCLTRASLKYMSRRLRLKISESDTNEMLSTGDEYQYPFAEGFFRMLGASSVESIDASEYEGASIVQDLGKDLPDHLQSRFTAVVDCGTLEHVFDVPTALRNSLSLVAEGGHYIGVLPCNNQMGHGFYQFSPELFFGVLSKQNGFVLEKMYVCERLGLPSYYEVPNPADAGGRIELRSAGSTYLFFRARRVGPIPSGRINVFQSDYVSSWEHRDEPEPAFREKLIVSMKRMLHPFVFEAIRAGAISLSRNGSIRNLQKASW